MQHIPFSIVVASRFGYLADQSKHVSGESVSLYLSYLTSHTNFVLASDSSTCQIRTYSAPDARKSGLSVDSGAHCNFDDGYS